MTTAIAKATPAELEQLSTGIREAHEACERDAQSAVEWAIRCGELLTEAKARVKHGEWLPWLEANFPAHQNTASNYMRLASNSQRVVNSASVREALAELAEPRPAPDPPNTSPPGPARPESAPDYDDAEEVVDAEIVEEPSESSPDPGPRVKCPTCGHMVKPDDIGAWRE
jgi:hypothetical protein